MFKLHQKSKDSDKPTQTQKRSARSLQKTHSQIFFRKFRPVAHTPSFSLLLSFIFSFYTRSSLFTNPLSNSLRKDNFVYFKTFLSIICEIGAFTESSRICSTVRFDNPDLSTDPLWSSLREDREVESRRSARQSVARYRFETSSSALPPTAPPSPAQPNAVEPVLGETLESLGSSALQDLVFARDLPRFEHLVLLTKPLRTALRMGSLLHHSFQRGPTSPPRRPAPFAPAMRAPRRGTTRPPSGQPAPCSARHHITRRLNGLPSLNSSKVALEPNSPTQCAQLIRGIPLNTICLLPFRNLRRSQGFPPTNRCKPERDGPLAREVLRNHEAHRCASLLRHLPHCSTFSKNSTTYPLGSLVKSNTSPLASRQIQRHFGMKAIAAPSCFCLVIPRRILKITLF